MYSIFRVPSVCFVVVLYSLMMEVTIATQRTEFVWPIPDLPFTDVTARAYVGAREIAMQGFLDGDIAIGQLFQDTTFDTDFKYVADGVEMPRGRYISTLQTAKRLMKYFNIEYVYVNFTSDVELEEETVNYVAYFNASFLGYNYTLVKNYAQDVFLSDGRWLRVGGQDAQSSSTMRNIVKWLKLRSKDDTINGNANGQAQGQGQQSAFMSSMEYALRNYPTQLFIFAMICVLSIAWLLYSVPRLCCGRKHTSDKKYDVVAVTDSDTNSDSVVYEEQPQQYFSATSNSNTDTD